MLCVKGRLQVVAITTATPVHRVGRPETNITR